MEEGLIGDDMKPMSIEGLDILEELEPLFIEAIEEDLWFHCSYQDTWLSPKELKVHHKNGAYIWSVENWKLLDPQIKIKHLEEEIEKSKLELCKFKERVSIHESDHL